MPVELTVPQSGESITEVQIGQWRKAVGDFVEADEVLVEIETDKAAIELPAPVSGILKEIRKKDGEEAAVGDVIGLMEEGGAPANGDKPAKKAAKSEEPKAEAKPEPKAAPAPAPQPEAKPEVKASSEPRVMPSAQRVLAQAGVDAAAVEGTGPGGRITKEDAERAAAPTAEAPAPTPAPRVEPEPPSAPPVASNVAGREEEVKAMTPMRKVIAKNLVHAQQTAALLTTFNEVDMGAVMELRKRYQEDFIARYGIKLGFMSFFVKAVVEALKDCPAINARIDGTHIVYRKYYDVGIAVGGGRGLVVPILRNAETMSFATIEKTIADFGKRAKDNKIELSELQGGTFTISNGGIYGSMLSTPIVNPPQSGILGLHNIQDRPVARDGQVVI
ncbi:MAG: 2-oxoglutarate dehydrogenase complex dihydrolipoyllysine-residue succinyltransferase, partial [Acidobacteria bacterium]|nr:2-oxoglutarate dehydrogenase complex dihydrolipoyllysine-residue succinyltransferase [Acidobacteriota bacterium]